MIAQVVTKSKQAKKAKAGTTQLQDSEIGGEKGKTSTTQANCRQAVPSDENEG